ncbi:hypothetical protein PFISCL1PPCAC_21150 [Pristionchus fissidentatus]|uniref:Ribosomal protein n=1 Tax=Pristionchus fissidentatus TaxID=1538716 RepID=A0AAV5WED7_9BILA|nr:hypothetical protein PFISCL1PPCAC_21150 [Pristionchus fissidentatus]
MIRSIPWLHCIIRCRSITKPRPSTIDKNNSSTCFSRYVNSSKRSEKKYENVSLITSKGGQTNRRCKTSGQHSVHNN